MINYERQITLGDEIKELIQMEEIGYENKVEITLKIKVNKEAQELIFKKSFNKTDDVSYEEQIKADKQSINNLKKSNFDLWIIYELGFRTDSKNFLEVINNNRLSVATTLIGSVFSAIGTTVLFQEGLLWSQAAKEGVALPARTVNATMPLIINIITCYNEANKYSYNHKQHYKKISSALALGDLVGMFATLAETYAFNRSNLPEEEHFNVKALFASSENFAKVYLNKFSAPFIAEQLLRTINNVLVILKNQTELINDKTMAVIKSLIGALSSFIVTGAFANVSEALFTNRMKNNNIFLNIVGIQAASLGANIGSAIATYSGFNWLKSWFVAEPTSPDTTEQLTDSSNDSNDDSLCEVVTHREDKLDNETYYDALEESHESCSNKVMTEEKNELANHSPSTSSDNNSSQNNSMSAVDDSHQESISRENKPVEEFHDAWSSKVLTQWNDKSDSHSPSTPANDNSSQNKADVYSQDTTYNEDLERSINLEQTTNKLNINQRV